ncbi:nickel-binding protein [uncultured Roseobacter sp.]|uniref:nickel-binding protein n=1 Tax=uncultured Roseobacter sp. TaxID=114847 RepID=UPI00262C9F84|nr:nickel-binding protein [uncultured Roseobacter sp.]
MFKFASFCAVLVAALFTPVAGFAGQFVVELDAPFEAPPAALMQQAGVSVDETLSAGPDSYVVLTANNEDAVRDLFQAAAITPEKISEVLFINSPTVGGGQAAGAEPRDGHQVFVIERPIPGVGFFGLDKKEKISKGSNAAVAKLGDVIEWDHSYLTGEGTYCIYRADNPDTLREHGALAGAPIGKITPVSQVAN